MATAQPRFTRLVWLAAVLVIPIGKPGMADDPPDSRKPADAAEDDEVSPYQSGLIARYAGPDGVEHARLDEQIAFHWGNSAPDRRLPAGQFTASFSGRLQVQSPGMYRLRVFAAGAVRLKVDGKQLLDASREPKWLDAEPIELPFGYHPIEVAYRRTDEPGRLALFWEGPRFGLEPIAGRWLYHETGKTPLAVFEQGAQLVRALRCAVCHEISGEPPIARAASFGRLAGNLSRGWLVNWLSEAPVEKTTQQAGAALRRMPHFRFDRAAAESVADYLFEASEKLVEPTAPPVAPAQPAETKKKPKKEQIVKPRPPSAEAGATLFRSLGCLACHRVGELGTDNLFGGGDLARLAEKRPADFFARWLADPAGINSGHRMPVFALERPEIDSLSLYLQSLGDKSAAEKTPTSSQAARGRELVKQARCAQCHVLPKADDGEAIRNMAKMDLAALERDKDNCLFEPDTGKHRPGYRLDDSQRRAVVTFIAAVSRVPSVAKARSGADLLAELNCLACHARGQSRGLTAHLPVIAETDPNLRDVLPALAPPALFGVGDKLHDEALVAAITRADPARRPWLRVRMPRFPLGDEQARSLAQHFIDSDRIPERPQVEKPADTAAKSASNSNTAMEAAGARLVTADGFGCTSCHAIGKWKPPNVALNAVGSNLSLVGSRIRHEWFDRWVRNPARIVPQMEMPAVQQSARGVLDENLDRQLMAIWQVLNRKDFTPPSPNALRVVRRANIPGIHERAAVLTENIEVDGRHFVKPLVIGLANRHNVLVDLATHRLAAWWLGDAARQQTQGKSWYWEAGVPQLLPKSQESAAVASDILLIRDGKSIPPVPNGDYLTEFDSFQHVDGGVELTTRLRFRTEGEDDDKPGATKRERVIRVVQRLRALAQPDAASGFTRSVQIESVPPGVQVELVAIGGDATIDTQGRTASVPGRAARLHVTLRSPGAARFSQTAQGATVRFDDPKQQAIACELEYRCDVPADQFAPLPQADRSVTQATLNVVPGFEAVRLPVTNQAMPTGLAWRGDGTLVVSSLEGRVWLARDTDGDGIEDQLLPFSDDLAAPYGVAAAGDAIDVINKYGLLRLTDRDGDGQADCTELLASGWGHTRDYHDWAIGLPRDPMGNYYVSLPCQQDERSEAGATLRGSVIKLVPREPTDSDPRRMAIEPLAAGLRFANGIALSPAGDLFVTDNQGNYTPFNELNHIVRGARYGFINRMESKRGLNPPFRPAAVEIPHPWTRSVNGICFLATPAAVRERLGRDLFGPLEGHLVGCEYDTRRLVRMSLERVGDDFQGAVYPLSIEPAGGEETFEGPLVCQVSPLGDVYIGNIRDSGWGAGSNTGSLVRLRWSGELPPGIAEVRAQRGGFSIDFTTLVDAKRASRAANYSVSSYRRTPTPNYGGPDQDRRIERIKSVQLSPDTRRATIELDGLHEGFVYEFHLRDLAGGSRFFPSEAYYTLRHRVP